MTEQNKWGRVYVSRDGSNLFGTVRTQAGYVVVRFNAESYLFGEAVQLHPWGDNIGTEFGTTRATRQAAADHARRLAQQER